VLNLDLALTSFNLGSGFNIYSAVTDAVLTTNYLFDFRNGGYLSDGGANNPSLSDAYDGAYYFSFNNRQHSSSAARFELANRQLVIGPEAYGTLSAIRKIYVPETGGYARYLEMVTNTDANTAASVSFNVSGNLGSDSGTRFFKLPSDSANRYVVSYESSRYDPSLAHVYASAVGTKPTATQFVSGNDNVSYRWDGVLIPPGETRCVLHFAVQRKPYDEAVGQAEAEALVSFTDPAMLNGLTDAEKGCIINFVPDAGW
jgi:hypothetical protein